MHAQAPMFPAREAQTSSGSLLGGMGAFVIHGQSISILSTEMDD
jgi:hypothetical protein